MQHPTMAWTVLKSWQLLKESVGQSQSSLWRPEELVLISQGGVSIDHTFVLFLGSLCKMGAIFCRTGFKIKLILMGVLNQQLAGIGDVMNLGWLLFASFESLLFAKFERGCELPVDQLARGR